VSASAETQGELLNATVQAFLEFETYGQNITAQNVSSTLEYEAVAVFNFTDVPRTVSHFVKAANRDDYVGKTLVRGVKYEADTGELVLSPKEKVMGVAFSLLWRPSRNHSTT